MHFKLINSFQISNFKFQILRLLAALSIFTIASALIWRHFQTNVSAAWFDDSFIYRNAVPITTHNAAENNVYQAVTIDTSGAGQFQADCGDLRWTDQGGNLLPYYISSGCTTASTVVHVFFDIYPAGAQTLYYYYGNPSATNGFSATAFPTACAQSCTVGTIAGQEKTEGPVVYWKMDEGTGTILTASSGTASATLNSPVNLPTWQTEDMCVWGKCLYFEGSNATASAQATNILGIQTVSFWAKPASSSGTIPFISFSDGTGTQAITSSNLTLSAPGLTSPTYYVNGVNTTTLTANNWNHVVVTASGFNAVNPVLGKVHNVFFKGFIDDVKIYNYALTAAQVKSNYASRGMSKGSSSSFQPTNDPLSRGLVGYWKSDEATWSGTLAEVVDSSGNGSHGQAQGATNGKAYPSTGKFGSAGYFDGVDDYVDMGNISTLNPNQGDFSMSVWVYPNSLTGSQYLVQKRAGSTGTEKGYSFTLSGSSPRLYWGDGTSGVDVSSGTGTLVLSTWQHVVFTYKYGQIARVYIDGVQTSADINLGSVTGSVNPTDTFRLGRNAVTFNGRLDDVRIYNRFLTPAEIQQLYNWAPGPVGYWKFDEGIGNPADFSGNGNNGTATAGTGGYVNGKFGKAYSFDGSNTTISAGSGTSVDNLKEFSISAWVYPRSDGEVGEGAVISKESGGDTGGWIFRVDSAVLDRWAVNLNRGTQNLIVYSANNSRTDNAWQHITITNDNSLVASNIKIYVNGVLSAHALDQNGSGTRDDDASQTLIIGNVPGAAQTFDGIIDELKIYNYVRTPKQIIEDMNAGHPAAGSPVASQMDYWKFDEGQGYYATSSGITATTGTISPSISVPPSVGLSGWQQSGKFGKALAFNGTNNYVSFGDLAYAKNVGTMSASFWVRPNTLATTTCLLCKWNNTAGAASRGWGIETDSSDSTKIKLEISTDGNTGIASALTATATLTNNSWAHVVMVYDSSGITNADILKLYVNGRQKTLTFTGTIPNLLQNNTINTRAGSSSDGARFFSGLIDEIKLYSGALSASEILVEYNRGSSIQLGSLGTASQSASMQYCIPGDSTSCAAPVAEWRFEEKAGLATYDTSGYGTTGTLGSAVKWKIGKIGSTVDFDGVAGTTSVITTATNTALDNIDVITIEAWINPRTFGISNFGRIWAKNSNSALHRQLLLDGSNGCTNCMRWHQSFSGGSQQWKTPDNSIVSNVWQHVALVYDRTSVSNDPTMYINGVRQSATAISAPPTGTALTDASDTVTIGNMSNSSAWNRTFDGLIDEVKVYNYARSAAQIAWDYNRGAPVAHWKFDECQGTTLNDASGNGNVGTWSGSGGGHTTVGTCVTSAATAWYNGRSGKYNGSLDFDGGDDVVNAGSNAVLDDLGPYSLSFWMKPDSSAQGYIISKRDSCAGPWRISVGSGTINWFKTTTTGDISFAATSSYSDSVWSHVVVTWDGTVNSSGAKVYVNGILKTKSSETDGVAPILTDATCSVRIGDRSNNTEPFEGQIDDVKIFNYVLTPTQIGLEYNQSSSVRFGPATGSP